MQDSSCYIGDIPPSGENQLPAPDWGSKKPCAMVGGDLQGFYKGKEESKNVKNGEVFVLEYIPEKILLREQAVEIESIMGSYITRGLVDHILISGLRGTGKTLTIRYLLKLAEKFAENEGVKIQTFYIPVETHRTSYSILREITGLRKGLPPEDLYKEARKRINERRTIIALDEADRLKDHGILYFLTRNTSSMVITIVTSPFWTEKLDDRIQSSFQPIPIHFPEYKAEELFEILKQRAEMGLYHYDLNGIAYLAHNVADDLKGDARCGILALKHMGKWDKWDGDAADRAIVAGVRELEWMLLRKINKRELLILYLLSSRPDGMGTAALYDKYNEAFGKSKYTFFSDLDELEKLNLISTVGRNELKHGGQPFIVRSLVRNPDLIKEAMRIKREEPDLERDLERLIEQL
jgi:cell division control protein 6